jgi:hypothetical protein
MHEKVAQPGRRTPDPNQPNWEDECRSLGITPELVRQWKRRTQAETDIRHLLGKEDQRPGKKTSSEVNAQALKDLERICRTVLGGDEIVAEQMALALAERYKF